MPTYSSGPRAARWPPGRYDPYGQIGTGQGEAPTVGPDRQQIRGTLRPVPIRLLQHRYERLSPQDASFLVFEKPDLPMHVGMLAFFERGSFAAPDGHIDLDKFRAYIASRLPQAQRCRHKLAYIPLARQPVWIADEAFDLANHVRDVQLAAPGDEAALRELAGQVFSKHLDRSRPLWEMWVVQGFDDPDRFAIITKVHHCMIDGIAAVDFIGALLTPEPVAEIAPAPAYTPTPAPHRFRLLLDEAARWLGASAGLAFAARRFVTSSETRASFHERTRAVVTLLARGIRGTSPSPLHERAAGRRHYAWVATERTGERAVRARIGGSRDDIAVATAAGATRDYLLRRGANPRKLRVRAMAPVSVRSRRERGRFGNRVTMLIAELPVAEEHPVRRLEAVTAHMLELKESKAGLGADTLTVIDRWTGTLAQKASMELGTYRHAFDMIVTNVPGPPVPLYLMESKMLAMYPLAPIFGAGHVGIAAITYLDRVHWGVQYGGEDPAEAARIVADVSAHFDALVRAAATAPPRLRVVEAPDEADDAANAASG